MVSPSPRAAAAEPRLIRTDHGASAIEVHTTKTGRMRVYCNGLEVLCTQLARAGKR